MGLPDSIQITNEDSNIVNIVGHMPTFRTGIILMNKLTLKMDIIRIHCGHMMVNCGLLIAGMVTEMTKISREN